ncbi:hypothetical protein [Bdellovibrio sp. HCB337]|uniref:hypothetical protein n=1 Tax=Bdellovibrio sp. HCB337 TaxID=3394358 RepID=UPI0039A75135
MIFGMNHLERIQPQRGSTIVSALVAVGVVSVMALASSAYVTSMHTQMKDVNVFFSLGQTQHNVLKALNSPAAWENTLADVSNKIAECKLKIDACGALNGDANFVIRDSMGNIMVEGESGSFYSYGGLTCTGDNCPIQVKSQWHLLCSEDGICSQMMVKLDFLTRGDNGFVSRRKFTVLKNYPIGKKTSTVVAEQEATERPAESFPTTKVVIIMDTSASMADNFLKVKNGIKSLLSKVGQYNAEVYFYSTASQLGQFYNWNNEVSNYYKGFDNVSSYAPVMVDANSYAAQTQPDFSLKLSIPLNSKLAVADLDSRIDQILSQYKPYPGTDRESGLCTLARIVEDSGPNRILNSNDLVYFIIVSDEDDAIMPIAGTSTISCDRAQTQKPIVSTVIQTTTASDPAADNVAIDFKFNFVNVTMSLKATKNDSSMSVLAPVCAEINGVVCKYRTPGTYPCPQEELDKVSNYYTSIQSCTMNVTMGNGGLNLNTSDPASIQILKGISCSVGPYPMGYKTYQSKEEVFASQRTYNPSTYAGCTMRFTKQVKNQFNWWFHELMDGTVVQTSYVSPAKMVGLKQDLIRKLNAKFGANGYAIRAFIQDPIKDQGLCTLTDGSYGTAYSDFIKMTQNPYSSYESICHDDYGFSFDTLSKIITQKVESTFIFPEVKEGQAISGVNVTRSGAEVSVCSNDYEIVGNKVIFKENVLQPGDKVSIYVKVVDPTVEIN